MELWHFCSCQETSGTPNEVKYLIIIRLCSVFVLWCTNKRRFCSMNFIWAVRKGLEKCLYFQGCHFITFPIASAIGQEFHFFLICCMTFFDEISIAKASYICTKPCIAVGQLITGLVLSSGKCRSWITLRDIVPLLFFHSGS